MAEVKLSGIEMMIFNLAKKSGFDPEAIAVKVQEFASGIKTGLEKVNTDLTAIREAQEKIQEDIKLLKEQVGIVEINDEETAPKIPLLKQEH